jgi:(5-formylfuran-3-yl)methyl phosphate synthase
MISQLLVSVRSAEEAEAALLGGAQLIDVKEPVRGALGRADRSTIADVIECAAKRVPTSAALGELTGDGEQASIPGLDYVKWGLAGWGNDSRWHKILQEAAAVQASAAWGDGCRPVAVAYADWQVAEAPSVAEVSAFVRSQGFPAILIDTWQKDGRTLLDWLSLGQIEQLCQECQAAGTRVALAGSLGPAQIRLLRAIEPDWFAVRGAACRGGRMGMIDVGAVRSLVRLLVGQ